MKRLAAVSITALCVSAVLTGCGTDDTKADEETKDGNQVAVPTSTPDEAAKEHGEALLKGDATTACSLFSKAGEKKALAMASQFGMIPEDATCEDYVKEYAQVMSAAGAGDIKITATITEPGETKATVQVTQTTPNSATNTETMMVVEDGEWKVDGFGEGSVEADF